MVKDAVLWQILTLAARFGFAASAGGAMNTSVAEKIIVDVSTEINLLIGSPASQVIYNPSSRPI